MKITHTVEPLDSNAAWSRLARVLGGAGLDVVRNTIRHLRVLNARCYVLEDPYIDRDYSADYAQFYALTFHAHERHCKRVHFFSQDISPLLQRPLSTARLNCPSSKQMGLLSVFHKGGSGSSLFDVKPLGVDGSSGGFGWSVF